MTHDENAGHELEPDSVLRIWQTAKMREATSTELALQVTGVRLP